jgi:N-acetylglucosamine malate deacetylase 1
VERRFVLVYYEVSNRMDTLLFSPNLYAEISAYTQRKREACFAHASQAPEMFYALQDQVCRFRGIENGCAPVVAFIRLGSAPDFFL